MTYGRTIFSPTPLFLLLVRQIIPYSRVLQFETAPRYSQAIEQGYKPAFIFLLVYFSYSCMSD